MIIRRLLTACLLLTSMNAFSQAFPEDSITKKFDAYRKQSLQEKVYLRTDRSTYITGELMWFKVYCVDGYNNQPLDLSKVVYVELLSENDESVAQRKVEMAGGIGSGSMFVPISLDAGNYKIRAYTNWMKNFSPDFYFHATITVVNTFVKTSPLAKAAPAYDAQFFPEGGDLVAGIRSKVGFRVTDKAGKGIAFHGAIINDRNDTVTHFKPLKFGIGNFRITPSADTKYRAVIVDQSGNRSIHPLRDVKPAGFVIRVTETPDALMVDVATSIQAENYAPVYLFAQCRQMIVTKEARTIQQGAASFKIKKSDIPPGITQITLFDRNFQARAERLFFTQPSKKMSVDTKTEIISHSTRSRLRLSVTSGLDANVSVSVYKNDSIPVPSNIALHDYLWLTSDLKGTVESPDYYFSSNDTTVARAADNLMLTHGWRRFAWSDVMKPTKDYTYLPEYRGHIIRGIVTDFNNQPANGVLTYLASPQLFVRPFGSRSNNKGEIQFEVKDFYGTRKIYVQTNQRIDSLSRIRLLNPFSDQYAQYPLSKLVLPPTIGKQLLDRSVSMQAQDIFFRDQVNTFIPAAIDSLQFYGPADEKYNLDDYTRFPLLEEVLREYVPSVMVRKKKDGYHFMVIDKVNKALFREDPLILIDGVPVFNVDQVISFDPLKIKRLEVVSREYYEGTVTMPGIMSFSTYTGDLGDFPIDRRALVTNYEGVQLKREFYAPKYDNANEKQMRLPDPRTLLYWNPALMTKKGETSQIEFYSSDVTGNYTVVVEGMSKDGSAGTASTSFVVSKINN